jgi:hypothetical protein
MNDSLPVQILRTFSSEEIKNFEKFLTSPYFSIGRNLSPLFKYIKKYYPDFNSDMLDKKEVYKALFKKKYNDVMMRRLIADLNKMLIEFLRQEHISRIQFERDIFLLNELISRKLFSHIDKYLPSAEEKMEGCKFEDYTYYYKKLQLEIFKVTNLVKTDKEQLIPKNIQRLDYLLLCDFISNLSYIAHLYYTLLESYNLNINVDLLNSMVHEFDIEKILPMVKAISNESYLFAALNYYSIKSINEAGSEYYFKYKNMLFENINRFSKEFQFNFLRRLDHTCINHIKAGDENFIIENFTNTVFQIENRLYLAEGEKYMRVILYRSFILRAIEAGEIEWAVNFIQIYASKLPPGTSESMKIYGKAFVNFSLKNYDKALNNISKIKPDNIIINLDLKRLQLMLYFELKYSEEAMYSIDAFKHFLNDNKYVAAPRKESNMQFIKYYSGLLKAYSSKNDFNAGKLLKELHNAPYFENKKWLIEKAENPGI